MKSPILLITYKRLDTTKQVLESIEKYGPDRIYIFSDAPASSGDKSKVDEVRAYLNESISWPCTMQTFYSETNLGCKYGPQKAISWFFENEGSGIVLEDDTVPDLSFYTFCEELLEKYAMDRRIWNIGGTNALPDFQADGESSYFYSRFPHTWGWATWADRWQSHLNSMGRFLEDTKLTLSWEKYPNKAVVEHWCEMAQISYRDKLDAWDYLWSFRVFMNHGLSVVPKKNLVANIGFGADATHTFADSPESQEVGQLDFPLHHPTLLVPVTEFDTLFFEKNFNWKPFYKKFALHHIGSVLKNRLFKWSNK